MTTAFERVVAGVIAVALSAASAAYSQSLMPSGDNPLNLTAESLVWHRDDNKMVATGNARIIRSGVELRANMLTAHSRKGKAGDGDQFYRFDAEGNVQIISENERVFGDRGEYKIDDQNFVLVGNNLRIESSQGLITARDQLEYWEAKQLWEQIDSVAYTLKSFHESEVKLALDTADAPTCIRPDNLVK